MIPLPPLHEVLETLEKQVLPAAGGAALVMCLFLSLGRWGAALGSAVAVVAGFVWANWIGEPEHGGTPIAWKQEDPGWKLSPQLALILIGVGLISRWCELALKRLKPNIRWYLPGLILWVVRGTAVALISGNLVAKGSAAEYPWLSTAIAAAIFLEWIVLDNLARSEAPTRVAVYLAIILLVGGMFCLYLPYDSLREYCFIIGSAMFGIAVASASTNADTSGAIPAGVGILPCVMLAARVSVNSSIPLAAFWLIALSPLVLTPFLIPALRRRNDRLTRCAQAVLVLIPLAVAMVLAVQNSPEPF